MQFKQLFIIILFFSTCCVYAQKPYYNQRSEYLKANSVWAFGDSAGLNFNNGGPQAIRTSMSSFYGFPGKITSTYATLADPTTGKLLFYSIGHQVWNANHQLMKNGESLKFQEVGNNGQIACIVPSLNESNRYYLFHLLGNSIAGQKYSLDSGTLFYSIIDMNLDNGLGAVVPGKKNIPLSKDTLSTSMIAVPGDCGDIWLIVHSNNISMQPSFLAYHITKEGIDTIPVISSSGTVQHRLSFMAVSPDRQKIAIVDPALPNGLVLGKFNTSTGQVSSLIRLSGVPMTSVCFSPNNSKLFASGGNASLRNRQGIYQYDLSNPDSISQSLLEIAPPPPLLNNSVNGYSTLKLYNDTIYAVYPNSTHINRISQPNILGVACDFQLDAIPLLPNTEVKNGLVNEVVFPIPPDTVFSLAMDTTICDFDFSMEAPSGYERYQWDNESTDPKRTVSEPGKYWVLSISDCGYRVDTFIVTHEGLEIPVINANGPELFTTASFFSYQWMKDGTIIPNALGSKYIALEEGDYQVIVSNAIGCTDTSEVFRVEKETHILGNIDLAQQISIYPNPATDFIQINKPASARLQISLSDMEGRAIISTTEAGLISLKNLAKGIYLLRIMDEFGNLIKVEKVVKQ